MRFPLLPLCIALSLAVAPAWAGDREGTGGEGEAGSSVVGLGAQQLSRWLGAGNLQWQAIPYIDIETRNGTELSSSDGLTVPLARAGRWQAGVYGDYLWGRSRSDVGRHLAHALATINTRVHAGGFVEYAPVKAFSLGARLGHDLGSDGAYLTLSADYDLPPVGYLEQSLSLGWRGMNGAAMRRYFGVPAHTADALGIAHWRPGRGGQQASLNYSLFMPTSEHTGIALSVEYARLLGDAARSPLVVRFGSRNQWERTIAFVHHF